MGVALPSSVSLGSNVKFCYPFNQDLDRRSVYGVSYLSKLWTSIVVLCSSGVETLTFCDRFQVVNICVSSCFVSPEWAICLFVEGYYVDLIVGQHLLISNL